MLRKLLKYDLKSIFKFLLIFYSLAFVFGCFVRIFFSLEYSLMVDIIGQIFTGATISMMCSSLINNLMRTWVCFHKGFYGDESYLTHTLPVKKSTHYLSKLLCGIITLMVSAAVIAVVVFVAYYSKENLEMVKQFILPLADAYDVSLVAFLMAILGIFFLELLNVLQCGFLGIILGHKLNNNKMGMSVLFGFVTFMLTQTVVVLVMLVAGLFNEEIMGLFTGSTAVMTVEMAKGLVVMAAVVYSSVIAIVCAVAMKLFNKGVNVD